MLHPVFVIIFEQELYQISDPALGQGRLAILLVD